MDFNIYDIYTDASINLDKKLGCSGAVVVDRKQNKIVDEIYALRSNATNNMSEIIAIWLAVYKAAGLKYSETIPFQVNIFSDSKISLFGLREWIFGWIKNRKGDTLINSTGAVSNQEWFRDCFHTIIASNIKLKFFHQKGHVNENSIQSLYEAERTFRTSNIHSPHMIGTNSNILAIYNNYVDNTTRNHINTVLSGIDPRTIPNMAFIGDSYGPIMQFEFKDSEIDYYKSLIAGGLNYPKFY